MNAWKPGQRAMVEVEIDDIDGEHVRAVFPGRSPLVSGFVYSRTSDLLPVSAPDADTIESLRVAMLGTTDGDFIDPDSDIPAGEMFRLAAEWVMGRRLAVREPGRSEAERGTVHSSHTIKTIGEALSYAECALLNFYPGNSQRAMYARVIADLLADVKRQRPTGPDGKHGNRHTATCGCDDRRAVQVTGTEGGETRD